MRNQYPVLRLIFPDDFNRVGFRQVAIDGKTLRRSGSPTRDLGPLHLVSAWATEANLTLRQVAVDEKSNDSSS